MRLGRASAYGMLAMMEIARQVAESAAATSAAGLTLSRPSTNGHRRRKPNNSNGNGASPEASLRGLARATQISESTGIPVEYLRKVLQRLARARLVVSERGRGGGFRLSRGPRRVNLLEIIEAIEGPIDEVAFLGDGVMRGRVAREHPQLRHWRREASQGLRHLLGATTLADLMK